MPSSQRIERQIVQKTQHETPASPKRWFLVKADLEKTRERHAKHAGIVEVPDPIWDSLAQQLSRYTRHQSSLQTKDENASQQPEAKAKKHRQPTVTKLAPISTNKSHTARVAKQKSQNESRKTEIHSLGQSNAKVETQTRLTRRTISTTRPWTLRTLPPQEEVSAALGKKRGSVATQSEKRCPGGSQKPKKGTERTEQQQKGNVPQRELLLESQLLESQKQESQLLESQKQQEKNIPKNPTP